MFGFCNTHTKTKNPIVVFSRVFPCLAFFGLGNLLPIRYTDSCKGLLFTETDLGFAQHLLIADTDVRLL